jgi:hypothetical protein
VDTYDQIESEKHQYSTKSKLSEQDSLSKIILVYLSVIQFVDLLTDAKLFWDMYRYSRIKYVECTDTRIDYISDVDDEYYGHCSIVVEDIRDEDNKGYVGREAVEDRTFTFINSEGLEVLRNFNYDNSNETSYKIATTCMLICMLSTYLVAYSSIIKLFLDNGSYEPHIIK